MTTTIGSGVALTLSGGGIILNGGTITGGTVSCGSNPALIYAGTDNASTLASALQSSAGMVKFGLGELILSGGNTSPSGTIYVNSGVLNSENANALGTTGSGNGTIVSADASLELQGGIAIGNEYLTLNGNGVNGGGGLKNISGANSIAGPVAFNNPTLINTIAGSLTLSNTISGNAITKIGAGMLVLSGNNSSYIKAITVSEGVLKAQNSGALGTSAAGTTIADSPLSCRSRAAD